MVTLFAVTLALLSLLIVYRKLNNRYQEEKFRMKMHRLRNELRNLAIDNKVSCHTDEFEFLDYSISKSIKESYFISLFYLFMLERRHEKLSDIEQYKSYYDDFVTKFQRNHALVLVNKKRNKYLRDYIIAQNKITVFILRHILFVVVKMNSFKKYIGSKISQANYYPEVSGIY